MQSFSFQRKERTTVEGSKVLTVMEGIRMETILDLAYWSKTELKLVLLANRTLEKVEQLARMCSNSAVYLYSVSFKNTLFKQYL